MLTAIELNNFQSHVNSYLEFCPGVNVVVGKSDQGKSSILRAITWAFKNRPIGDAFVNFNLKPKDACSVAVEFDNGDFILRKKNAKINSYDVCGKKLKALRADVPEEVQTVHNMQDVNFQPQHEPYFLLNKSPGQVAKDFNEVARLQIMDTVLQKVNAAVRKSTGDIRYKDSEIAELQNKINKLNWIDGAEQQLNTIFECKAEIKEKTDFLDTLENLMEELCTVQAAISNTQNPACAIAELKELEVSISVIRDKRKEIDTLFRVVSVLKLNESALKGYDTLNNAQTAFKQLKNELQQITEKRIDGAQIESIILQLTKVTSSIAVCAANALSFRNKYNTELRRLGTCPTCGGSTKNL